MPDKISLSQDLKNIGINKNDIIYVHSSMKSIGWLNDGIHTLTDTFINILGEDGTLIVPTHTYSFIGLSIQPYEPNITPTSLGAFPEAIRKHPLANRSWNASHSSAAIGGKTNFLIDNHDPTNALGYNSPIHRMARSGGKILLIGVSHKANTTIHLAESITKLYTHLPYNNKWGEYTHMKLPDGTVQKYKQKEYPGCSSNFDIVQEYLINNNLVSFGKIGNAYSQLIDAGGMVEIITKLIKNQPDILLCNNHDCPCCPTRKQYLITGE